MTIVVFFAVLCAALMHAGWSAITKQHKDPGVMALAVAIGGGLIGAVALFFVPPIAPASWPYLAGTSVIHLVYFQTTIAAYKKGDLTLVYPIARGMAPVIATVLALVLLGENPSPLGWAGGGLIVLGAMAIAGDGFRLDDKGREAVLFALAAAAATACYTLADGQGARLSGHSFSFTAWLMVSMALTNAIAMRIMFGAQIVKDAIKILPMGFVGGAASFGSYAVALWAMTKAPIATVAALRESSIAFAVLIGIFLLREKPRLWRIVGSATILAGAATLRLS
jgi:drug/metabolite transporter (DMT)-like permease